MEDNPILKKQLSIEYAGNIDNYESFKRTVGASPLLYKHDLHFYNDDITTRHKRNIQQLRYLKELLKSGKIEHKMVKHNVINTFYPSFVLHHHYQIFVPLLHKYINSNKDLQALYQGSIKHESTGAVFHAKQRWDFKQSANQTPVLDGNGLIQMDKQTYFYSSVTSPYITHAAFIVKSEAGVSLAIVEVRNKSGHFNSYVETKDFGGTISQDYLPIGYNFSNVKPIIVLSMTVTNIQKYVQPLILKQRLLDFQHSLKDLHKSLWISIKYTTMRKQFRTLDNKKEERSIITYQAVASRIIDAFTTFMMFSDINCNIIQEEYYFQAYVELMKSAHHCILEQLVQLRETCGGFGYMQFSGHPGCIERVAYRSGFDENKQLDLTPKFLLVSHYYISTEEAQKHCTTPLTSQKPSFMDYFSVFLSICGNMRRKRGSLSVESYNREYLKQSALMAMHIKQNESRHDAKNIHCLLLQYGIVSYIIKNLVFINWELVKVDKQIFYNAVTQSKTQLLEKIAANLIYLGENLELTYLRNTIIGRENSDDFYKELLDASRNNLRNSKQFVDYVRQPIIEMLVENRARL